ncbi:MAG: class I SAM-dependent methyltransferase [Nitrososphaeria archaeon]
MNLGPYYNAQLYKARIRALERGLYSVGYTFCGSAVLEVGCGTGFYTEYCLQKGVKTYTGIDIAQISVYTLRQRYPYFKFIQADISLDIPSDIGDFDIVLAADVMFHIIPDRAFNQAIQNLLSHLKSGGLLIISDLFPRTRIQPVPHVCFHSINEYIHLFSPYCVYIIHQEPIFFLLYPLPLILSGNSKWKKGEIFQRYAKNLCKWNMFDKTFPTIAAWLDAKIFLPLSRRILGTSLGFLMSNMKWLFAAKGNLL